MYILHLLIFFNIKYEYSITLSDVERTI